MFDDPHAASIDDAIAAVNRTDNAFLIKYFLLKKMYVLLELFVPLHVTIILFGRRFNNVYTAYCTIIIVLTVQIMCYNMQKKYKYSEVFEEWVNILDSFTEMVEIFRFKYEFKSIYIRKMHKNQII